MTDEKQEQVEVQWDEALTGGNFIKLENEATKEIGIRNVKLMKMNKSFKEGEEAKPVVELQADCFWEDGKPVEKTFNTVSNPLKTKLEPLLKGKTGDVYMSIFKLGTGRNTNYSVKELPTPEQ